MSAAVTHDDIARFNFLANFNKYMATVVAPGNAVAFRFSMHKDGCENEIILQQ